MSYKKGESGDHNFTSLGMNISTGNPFIDTPLATCLPSSDTTTSIRSASERFFAATDKVNILRSISGVVFIDWIYFSATGSNHTVCHIPLTGVYHIPPGLFTCLPRGWYPLSVGSHTFTVNVLFPFCKAGVISKLNGVKPPV